MINAQEKPNWSRFVPNPNREIITKKTIFLCNLVNRLDAFRALARAPALNSNRPALSSSSCPVSILGKNNNNNRTRRLLFLKLFLVFSCVCGFFYGDTTTFSSSPADVQSGALTLSLNHQDRAQAYHKRNNPRAMDGQHFLLGDRGHTAAAGQQHTNRVV